MHARPRAKVNLSLSVGPRGRDGYHPLSSVFLRIGLSDELNVAFGDSTGDDVLTVTGLPGCEVEGNLVLRAFAAVRDALDMDFPPLVAHLDKRIPVAAGLGGGSADAAAAVDCALQMWGIGLTPDVLDRVALELGADVPFFAHNLDAALVSGRGEKLEPLKINTNPGLLLVTPRVALSTAAVFERFDSITAKPERRRPQMPDFTYLAEQSASLRDANDLWPAAVDLSKELGSVRGELENLSDLPWLMSGSGSTLFSIYESGSQAVATGQSILASESEVLGGALFNAVDLFGPDPLWRYP